MAPVDSKFLEARNTLLTHRIQQHAFQTEALNKYCLTHHKSQKVRNIVVLWREGGV